MTDQIADAESRWHRIVNRVWQGIIVSLPIWMTLVGIILFYAGTAGTGNDWSALHKELLYSIASAVLSGGVFAAVLNSMQFLNIFEEAIEKVIYGSPSWLRTLPSARLEKLWIDVTSARVAKGFPALSHSIKSAVSRRVISKMGEYYYSKMGRELKLRSYDTNTDLLVMEEVYHLCINAHDAATEIPFRFKLSGDPLPAEFGEPFVVESLLINGVECRDKVAVSVANGTVTVEHNIPLSGQAQYHVVRVMTRTVKLGSDPVLNLTTKRFSQGIKLRVETNGTGLRVSAQAFGGFQLQENTVNSGAYEWESTDLLFPENGLTVVFKKP